MVRVFHCDDSPAFRLLIREILGEAPDVEVAGEAGTLDEALARLPGTRPDVVLVDLFGRERSADLLALLRGAAPGARLVVYSGMPEDGAPPGADAYVHKSAPFDELQRAIRQAAAA